MAQTTTATIVATATETTINNYKAAWTPERKAAHSLRMKGNKYRATYTAAHIGVSPIGVNAVNGKKKDGRKTMWTKERKAAFSEHMKEVWASKRGIGMHLAISKGHTKSAIKKQDLLMSNLQANLASLQVQLAEITKTIEALS